MEAIYPSLAQGVGIPIERRVKPIIQQRLATKSTTGIVQLEAVTDLLLRIWNGKGPLAEALARRSLSDLVAATGELAFNTDTRSEKERETWREKWKKLVDGCVPPSTLFNSEKWTDKQLDGLVFRLG